MALRRPGSSRARLGSSANQMPPPNLPVPRARSVLAKQPRPPTESTPRTTSHTPDAETNIQVVIRCRRRSEREVQDNSPIIVSSTGAKSREVSIETSAPISSLGIITLPPVRTYPFDLVFGPEADQAMIYHDVVSPMLDEVLMGYNCTLFAYGQTGTGKTYTMQGDLTPTPMGNPSANAGMIPRVLFRLFHWLETSNTDYSVKISYIELYNEELRDLLSNDLSAPQGTIQPMGMGMAKDSTSRNASENSGGMKIFDDANKQGVFIQGLEEVNVKDSQDALGLLTKGSQRRQIAATKFNDHSSRSHSVFSITIHIKEKTTTGIGDDLLRVGKLNLVDLAGSENIGRSGAENKRAREAGMINQSLLTLGRVINALVDKSSHVPYRESKLTRLLQDSLGGRTKTCIIATISPARSNMEETLSTLDYAMRAKSIRNKPELNQRMSRNSLLKEYVAEIERLKADVLAAREKNGIFFSEETWIQLSAEQELKQTELEEAKKQVEIVENQMRGVRDEYEQSIALLKKRDGELKDTREKLKQTEDVLEAKKRELRVVKVALEEEVVVREAHQETEEVLDDVAIGLRKTAKESIRDITGLFDALHRKTAVFKSNSRAVLTHGSTITSETTTLSQELEEFVKTSSQHTYQLRTEAKEFETKELEALASHSTRIDQQLLRIQEALSSIQSRDVAEGEALSVVQTVVKETHETFKTGFGRWGESLTKTCNTLCQEVELVGLEGFSTVEKALKSMGTIIENIVRATGEYVDSECKSLAQAKDLVEGAATKEIERLRTQNEALVALVTTQKIEADKAKDQLVLRVSGLLGEFTKERDKGLREAVELIRSGNEEGEEEMEALAGKHAQTVDAMDKIGKDMAVTVKSTGGEGKRTRDGALKSLSAASTTFSDKLTDMETSVSGSIRTYSTQVQKQTKAMNATCSDAFETHGRAKRARLEAMDAMAVDVQSNFHYLKDGVASTSSNIGLAVGRVESETEDLVNATETFHSSAATQLSTVLRTTETLLVEGAKEDPTTGSTPKKRAWKYVDQWELTKGRDVLLKEWRGKGVSNVGSDTFVAEHLPLPDDQDEDEDGMMILDGVNVPDNFSTVDSMASSSSSLSARPISRNSITIKKNAVPVQKSGTLTDSRVNNIRTASRASKRARP